MFITQSNIYYISIYQFRLPTVFNYLDLIIYLTITSWRYIIKYKTLLKSLKKSTKEYKNILKYKKAIKAYKVKPIKYLKAVKTLI